MATSSISDKFIGIINQITCKLNLPGNRVCSGIITQINNESITIFTVKHFFKEKYNKADLEISFYNKRKNIAQYRCVEKDEIFFSNNDFFDIAIIIIKEIKIINKYYKKIDFDEIKFIGSNYVEGKGVIRGFPQGANEEPTSISVQFNDFNKIRPCQPAFSDSLSTDELYKGFSGSGIFFQKGDYLNICGTAFSLDPNFQIISTNNLTAYNSLLVQEGKSILSFFRLFREEFQNDVDILLRHSKETLQSIKNTIGTISLERKGIREKLNSIIDNNSTVIVSGEAGAGKSAMVKDIFSEIKTQNNTILAFKADNFGQQTLDEFSYSINLKQPIHKVIEEIASFQKIIIFIDSLEKIVDIKERSAIETFINFCRPWKNVLFILTCRSFALQSLLIDLDYLLPKPYQLFSIPFLEIKEIEPIRDKYPYALSSIPDKYKDKIIRTPFFLDLIIRNFKEGEEKKQFLNFFELIWNKMIVKGNPQRGECLMKIAYKRASLMSLDVSIDGYSPGIINELLNDRIITLSIYDSSKFSPSHDIFEDFGLIKFIVAKYDDYGPSYLNFVENLDGNVPAIRRAYRLWLNKALESMSYDIKIYIIEILNDDSVDQFWRDETITALLQSDYLDSFLEECKDSILSDNGYLFKRFIKMLTITCQVPNDSLYSFVSKNYGEKNYYDYFHLVPKGDCWESLFVFYSNNIEKLNFHFFYVIEVIVEYWINKKFSFHSKSIPNEKIIGSLLLEFIDNYKNHQLELVENLFGDGQKEEFFKNPFYGKKSDHLFRKSVIALFELTEKLPDEIQGIIEEALEFKKGKQLSTYSDLILKKVLSWEYSAQLCKYLPDVVIETAKRVWIKEEIEKDRFYHSYSELEDSFGIEYNSSFFHASPYKTPLLYLLKNHPWKAFDFILFILNHSTNHYVKSNFEEKFKDNDGSAFPIEIDVQLNDGITIKQYGNPLLWCMYRGAHRTSPYLLQSILMSLEKFLLEFVNIKADWVSNAIKKIFEYLLRNSKTIAITSVLASLAVAHPELLAESFFPLFRVREFFFWDITRKVVEHSSLAPVDNRNSYNQKERIKSNNLPHRNKDLERLICNMQLGKYKDRIFEIFDQHKKDLKNEDVEWKNILTRIDSRNWEPGKIVDLENGLKGVTIEVKQDADVIKQHKEYDEMMGERRKLYEISGWSRDLLDRKKVENNSFDQWRRYYKFITGKRNLQDPYLEDFSGFAVVGIRDFLSKLSKKEKKYCVDIILSLLRSQFTLPWDQHIPQVMSFTTYCIDILPKLFLLDIESIQENVLFFLFMLLANIHVSDFNEDQHIIKAIDCIAEERNDVADLFFKGFIGYYFFYQEYNRLVYENRNENIKDLFFHFIDDFLTNNITSEIEKIPFDNISVFIFERAVKLLPIMVNLNDVNNLFIAIFYKYISIGYSESNDFEFLFSWRRAYTDFIFKNNSKQAKKYFSEFIDFISNNNDMQYMVDPRYIKEIFDSIIVKADLNNELSEILWELWSFLYIKAKDDIRITILEKIISFLFLSIDGGWKSSAVEWSPLRGRKSYFKNVFDDFAKENLKEAVSLLAGIGFKELLPDGIFWLREKLSDTEVALEIILNENLLYLFEKLILRVYHLNRKELMESRRLKDELLYLLDILIELGSPISYIIRDRVLSLRIFDSYS